MWAQTGLSWGRLGPVWARLGACFARPFSTRLGPFGRIWPHTPFCTPLLAPPCEAEAAEGNPDAQAIVGRRARRQGLPARSVVERTGDIFIIRGDGCMEAEIARVLQDRKTVCDERNVDAATILDKETQAPSHMEGCQGGNNREGRSRQHISDRRQQVQTHPNQEQ